MKIFKSITGLMIAASALVLTAGSALAGDPNPLPATRIAEPGALAIFAIGIVGAIAVARFRGRK